MLRGLAKWAWALIPVAVVAAVVLVVNSPDPGAAILDLIWAGVVIGLLVYISVSARRKAPGPDKDSLDEEQ